MTKLKKMFHKNQSFFEEEAMSKVNRLEHENLTLKAKLERSEVKRREEIEKAKQNSRIAKQHVEDVQKETRRLDGESEQQRFEIDRLSREIAILTSENQGLKRKLTRFQRESRSLKQIEDSMSDYLKGKVLGAPPPVPTSPPKKVQKKKGLVQLWRESGSRPENRTSSHAMPSLSSFWWCWAWGPSSQIVPTLSMM